MTEPAPKRLLLDTHTFLWMVSDPDRLGGRARTLIDDPRTTTLLSLGSVWEIAIKSSLGKLELPSPLGLFLEEQLQLTRTGLLDLRVQHLLRVEQLPFHHRDPFDRLLAAQAESEKIPILSVDPAFDEYPVQRIWDL